MTTFEKLCKILSEEFQIDENAFTPETTFSELGLDSLQIVDAVMRIEEGFDVEISDEELQKLYCLSDVCDLLQGKGR